MPSDPSTARTGEAGQVATALRRAARPPRMPVDAERVLERARSLRRRRTVLSAAGLTALLVPLVALALVRPWGSLHVFDGDGGDAVQTTIEGREAPPRDLVDGSPVGEVPDAVARRFPGPVVATRRDPDLGAAPPQPCSSTPLTRSADGEAAEVGARLDGLAAAARPVSAHVGPAIATTLAVGHATAPPAYSGAYAAVCIARHDGDGWRSEGLGVDHLFEGWTAGSHLGDDRLPPQSVYVTAFEVPAGAAWAVQEHAGWWLAYEMRGDEWVLLHSPVPGGSEAFPGARVLFVDAAGGVIGSSRTGATALPPDAPVFRPQVVDARVDVGRASQVRARLAGGRPLPVCAREHGVCVWIVTTGEGEGAPLLALAAAGPHPIDVPPLGAVGHCPEHGTFQGTSTRSVFDARGHLLAGPAPAGLHRYDLVEEGGRILLDLSAFSFGPDADEGAVDPATARCAEPVEPPR